MMGEEAAVQDGFGGSQGSEKGVVGTYNREAVGSGVNRCGIRWQSVYLKHTLSNDCQFVCMDVHATEQDKRIGA